MSRFLENETSLYKFSLTDFLGKVKEKTSVGIHKISDKLPTLETTVDVASGAVPGYSDFQLFKAFGGTKNKTISTVGTVFIGILKYIMPILPMFDRSSPLAFYATLVAYSGFSAMNGYLIHVGKPKKPTTS